MTDKEKSIIEELKEIQGTLPNIILPTMGILDNNDKLVINNDEFINKNVSEEN